MCCEYNIPNGIFPIGQKVKVVSPVKGWFDFSIKREIPIGTVGWIFKIEKVSQDLEDIEYTVQFNKEFDYVKIKHKDLNNI